MSSTEALQRSVCAAIDTERDEIIGIGETIMDAPELGFKELRTAELVKSCFRRLHLPFDDSLAITGVRAVLNGSAPGPTIALMGELDALLVPDHPRACASSGAAHACGHNAQIAGMLGAASGLMRSGVASELSGRIVFLAVPAEEYVEIEYRLGLVRRGLTEFLTGKQELIRLGIFDDIDMALMIHTTGPDVHEGAAGLSPSFNGFMAKNIRFIGRAAHAGMAPERGLNALNAAQLALSAIHAQRETFRDEDCVRIHPIITKGGDLVNIVPSDVRMETYVRARTPDALLDAGMKVDRALRGAAIALGCQVEIETVPGNLPLRNNPELAEIFRETVHSIIEQESVRDYPHSGGSTDAGDLSQLMPVLHPMMTGACGSHHQTDWEIADKEAGYVIPSKTLAMMAVALLSQNAKRARHVLQNFKPGMSKEEYLSRQRSVFRIEVFS